jgi:hypothetical protein
MTPTEAMQNRLTSALEWALDLIDMYDARLEQLGDAPHLIHSDIHTRGKEMARKALADAQVASP